jgi:hypothetical protein
MGTRLNQLQQQITDAVAGMTPEQMAWHPPGKWSAAEVLEHLYLTYGGTIKGFERVAAAGKPLTTACTWAQRPRRWVVLGLGYLPHGRKAPSFVQPRGIEAEKVKAEVDAKISEMETIITDCERNLGNGRLLDHPILGPLTGAQWRRFHLVHGKHHVKQIRQLRAGSGSAA